MPKKVLFCFPPAEDDLVMKPVKNQVIMYGLGIPYLMSYLDNRGHTTEALMNFWYSWDEYFTLLKQKVEEFKPDFIGIQAFSMNRLNAFKIVKFCQENNIECFIGDAHVTALAEQVCSHYKVTVVMGEGEVTVSEIVEGKPLWEVNGIAYYDPLHENVVINEPRDLIEDLDSIPFPRHDIYFDAMPEVKWASIFTSRGCPRKCSFCCIRQMRRNRIRLRSVKNVIDEIVWLKKKYPRIERIVFLDDTMTLYPKRVEEICDELIRLDLKLKFTLAGTIRGSTPEMFEKMARAGLDHIYVGLESGSQELLNHAHKGQKLEDVVTFFENAKNYPQVMISTYIITGLPGETWDTVKESIAFCNRLSRIRYNYIDSTTIIWAFPGTEIYDMMKERGFINDNYWLYDNDCPNYTVEHDAYTLRKMQHYFMNRASYSRMFTPVGFWYQFTNSPINVLKFMWYHPERIRWCLGASLQYQFPRFYTWLRKNPVEERWRRLDE